MSDNNPQNNENVSIESLLDQASEDARKSIDTIRKQFQEYALVLSGAKGGAPEDHIRNLTLHLDVQEEAILKTIEGWRTAFIKASENKWDSSQSIEDLETAIRSATMEIAKTPKGPNSSFPGIH